MRVRLASWLAIALAAVFLVAVDHSFTSGRSLSGARDITLHRIDGRWFIRRP